MLRDLVFQMFAEDPLKDLAIEYMHSIARTALDVNASYRLAGNALCAIVAIVLLIAMEYRHKHSRSASSRRYLQ